MSIEISHRQSKVVVDEKPLIEAASNILVDSRFETAEVSIVIVDDEEMHQLNVEYLNHDYPTDVLSFPLVSTKTELSGEVIVSVDTASREAAEHGLRPDEELLLYVVHGHQHVRFQWLVAASWRRIRTNWVARLSQA